MALQLGALRDALLAANVPADKANRAAEEVATFEIRFVGIDTGMAQVKGRLAGVNARLGILTWAVGINIALTLATLAKLIAQH